MCFALTDDQNRLEACLRWSTKFDYRENSTSTTFASLCDKADKRLFYQVTYNKCPKQFGKRPHRRLVMSTPAAAKHSSAACSEQAHSPTADIIHSRVDSYNRPAYVPIKSVLSSGGSEPHLIRGSLDPHESDPQTASQSIPSFLYSSPVCPTYRHTDHATCDI